MLSCYVWLHWQSLSGTCSAYQSTALSELYHSLVQSKDTQLYAPHVVGAAPRYTTANSGRVDLQHYLPVAVQYLYLWLPCVAEDAGEERERLHEAGYDSYMAGYGRTPFSTLLPSLTWLFITVYLRSVPETEPRAYYPGPRVSYIYHPLITSYWSLRVSFMYRLISGLPCLSTQSVSTSTWRLCGSTETRSTSSGLWVST